MWVLNALSWGLRGGEQQLREECQPGDPGKLLWCVPRGTRKCHRIPHGTQTGAQKRLKESLLTHPEGSVIGIRKKESDGVGGAVPRGHVRHDHLQLMGTRSKWQPLSHCSAKPAAPDNGSCCRHLPTGKRDKDKERWKILNSVKLWIHHV